MSCSEKSARWHSRDLAALARKLDTLPLIMDLDLASSNEAAVQVMQLARVKSVMFTSFHVTLNN